MGWDTRRGGSFGSRKSDGDRVFYQGMPASIYIIKQRPDYGIEIDIMSLRVTPWRFEINNEESRFPCSANDCRPMVGRQNSPTPAQTVRFPVPMASMASNWFKSFQS